ncbi:hypothetical protein [Lapidilactobacillus wuchangensis]|uniref:hypothetical protein n=1 Tax=Lapidilactobacillus wuchangensis TaxID=2486001 RepID=UPI0013DE178E|nr:hypothetical protein [Lapidilactobacillus wuchangensis]
MPTFKIGDLVQLPQKTWQNIIAVIVFYDAKHDRYLVRIGGSQQVYFTAAELAPYPKTK